MPFIQCKIHNRNVKSSNMTIVTPPLHGSGSFRSMFMRELDTVPDTDDKNTQKKPPANITQTYVT